MHVRKQANTDARTPIQRHTRTQIQTHTHRDARTQIQTHTHTEARKYRRTRARIHARTQIQTLTRIHARKHANTDAHAHAHAQIQTHAFTRTRKYRSTYLRFYIFVEAGEAGRALETDDCVLRSRICAIVARNRRQPESKSVIFHYLYTCFTHALHILISFYTCTTKGSPRRPEKNSSR